MKKFTTFLPLKIIVVLFLIFGLWGFFYFETSLTLRILAIVLAIISVWQLGKESDIAVYYTLYLGIYDLYNIRYGWGVPIAIIMLAVLAMVTVLFYYQAQNHDLLGAMKNEIFRIYLLVINLVSLELFLAISLWPVDPRTKSVILMIVFFLISRLVYLYAHNVLNLKKAIGYFLTSFLILAIIIYLGS